MLEIAFIYLNSKLGFKIWMEIPDPDHVGTRGGSCSSIFLIHMLTSQLDPIVDINFLLRVRVLSVWRLISLSLQVIQINLYLAFQCCKQQCHQLRASHCWLHHSRLVMPGRHSYSIVEDQDVSAIHTNGFSFRSLSLSCYPFQTPNENVNINFFLTCCCYSFRGCLRC